LERHTGLLEAREALVDLVRDVLTQLRGPVIAEHVARRVSQVRADEASLLLLLDEDAPAQRPRSVGLDRIVGVEARAGLLGGAVEELAGGRRGGFSRRRAVGRSGRGGIRRIFRGGRGRGGTGLRQARGRL